MKNNRFSSQKYLRLVANVAAGFIQSREYQHVLNILVDCYHRGGTVFTMGCGGSASTATHFAADLAKTIAIGGKPGFKAISLVDNIPLVSAWTNDKGWGSVFAGQLEQWITKNDVLVGFSVHGGSTNTDKSGLPADAAHQALQAGHWSANLTEALQLAQRRKARIIGFAGFDGGAMKQMADACIVIPLDTEPYATPVIEALHVVLQHGIIYDLRERIAHA